MKYFIRIFISAMTLMILCTNCEYLESEEYLHQVDDINDIYNKRKRVREAMAACYGIMPNFTDYNTAWVFAGAYDECHAGRDIYANNHFGQGKATADHIVSTNVWKNMYLGIRRCNLFLERAVNSTDPSFEKGELEGYLADVRFLRAYYYSLLLKLYGPFVIIDHSIDYSSGQYPSTREPFDDCASWICDELDAVIPKLPTKENQSKRYLGRPTQAVAMAVKAEVKLWQASPLVNGNGDYASYLNQNGQQLISQTNDVTKWQDAADAYKSIIDLGTYHLHTVPFLEEGDYVTVPLGDFEGNDVVFPDGPAGIDPYNSYTQLFTGGENYWNDEVIWQVNKDNKELTNFGLPRGMVNGPWVPHLVSATQEIVDAFYVNNGKTIEEESTHLYNDLMNATEGDGYYIKGVLDIEGTPIQTNYLAATGASQAVPSRVLNREARFYASIGFQGRGYKQRLDLEPYYYGDFRKNTADGYVLATRSSTLTGYPIVKWVNEEDDKEHGNFEKQYPIYRMAEIYLSYAEALNEVQPGHADIAKYLNLVRFRAGLPGIPVSSQEEVRNFIKKERQIEFAFEGKRYFDMRRWKDATSNERDIWGNSKGLGGPVYGCNYDSSNSNFYQRTLIDGYVFKHKSYWLPLPYVEVANHWSKTTQSPGY